MGATTSGATGGASRLQAMTRNNSTIADAWIFIGHLFAAPADVGVARGFPIARRAPAYRNWFYADQDGDPASAEAIRERARVQVEAAWHRLDDQLADGRTFLLGDRKTAADHLATMLARWSRNMPRPAPSWSRVGAYVDRMRRDPGLREVHRREGLTDWIDE